MEPQLEHDRALGHEHRLQAVDAFEFAFELGARRAVHHAVEDRLGVPGPEQDPDPALRRKRAPETPHRWMRGFFVGRMTERMGMNVTWVHPFAEQIDGLAFAGSVSSAHDDNHRRARRPEKLVLSFEQRLAKLGLFASARQHRSMRLDRGHFPPLSYAGACRAGGCCAGSCRAGGGRTGHARGPGGLDRDTRPGRADVNAQG